MTSSYPLEWPDGWEQTPQNSRKIRTPFNTTFDVARRRLLNELKLFGAKNIVISSWLPLRSDGQPYADSARRRLESPGVAVYFTLDGEQIVMARDAYWTVHDNLRSIGLAVEALRTMHRHGGAQMAKRAFHGFSALPPPERAHPKRPWWQVLNFNADPTHNPSELRDEIMAVAQARYRRFAKEAHPDNGGSDEQMAELNQAIEEARSVLA